MEIEQLVGGSRTNGTDCSVYDVAGLTFGMRFIEERWRIHFLIFWYRDRDH
jgi:hypothetical protein